MKQELGKSLIIDSLNAITGSRVSKEIIRTGTSEALIEAYFCENGEEYVLSREVFQNGKNVCKVNGKLVTVTELKELGKKLIDIHGQHDNQSLLDVKTHIELLDSFAGIKLLTLKEKYYDLLLKYRETNLKLKNCYGDDQERARRLDLLNYQIEEIENANLKEDEEEELNSRRKIILSSEKLSKVINYSYSALDEGIIGELSKVTREISSISNIDSKYENLLKEINEAYYNLQDATETLKDCLDDTNFDEDEQSSIEERLDYISNLKRKYGKTISDVMDYLNKIKEEKYNLENSEELINKLKSEEEEYISKLKMISLEMSKIRKECAFKIEKLINNQMKDLEMKNAYLEFKFDLVDTFQDNGTDEVELQICTNAGDELKPLAKIASGGELSRVMLAIKTVLGDYDSIPTMIFDEIDTGISGQTGQAVAEKLKSISKNHQVICVTHLPAITASGDANFYIDKIVKSGKTKTKIKKLDEEEIIYEIARVIAGNAITEPILNYARRLRV